MRLAWYCGDSHLPEVGGIYDQNFKVMLRMRTLANVYNTVQAAPHYPGKAIQNMPENMLATIDWLAKIGLWQPGMSMSDV